MGKRVHGHGPHRLCWTSLRDSVLSLLCLSASKGDQTYLFIKEFLEPRTCAKPRKTVGKVEKSGYLKCLLDPGTQADSD